jgi:predicted DNA-binding transcriptional regulator AlpA
MPKEPEKEVPELMTIPEIATRRGLSRQRVHRIARNDPSFPKPVLEPGTTRVKYPVPDVDAYFENRVLEPGKRTDLEKKAEDDTEADDS